MRRLRVKLVLGVATVAVLGVGAVAVAGGGGRIDESLNGYEENPAVSTPGFGEFRATVDRGSQIRWRLTYSDFATDVQQAHIHFEKVTNNGPIVTFLCTNLGNGPVGTQECPRNGGTIAGVIEPEDVGVTPQSATQGIGQGEFAEFVRAIRVGATYVNVHTEQYTGGEIRAQLEDDDHRGHGHRDHDD